MRKGQKVLVDYTGQGRNEDNYRGPGTFVRMVKEEDTSYAVYNKIEPHCFVRVPQERYCCCFPLSSLKPA
jgi:hypothetical protein